MSLLSALNLRGTTDQIPHVVTTTQRPVLNTPVAAYEFYRIQAGLYGGFDPYRRTGNFDIATAEKALFDTLYLSARKGRRFAFLPEVELPAGFSVSELENWVELIDYPPLRIAVRKRWERLADRVGGGVEGPSI